MLPFPRAQGKKGGMFLSIGYSLLVHVQLQALEADCRHMVHTLFLLNVVLQLFDGLSTYQGVHQLGWQENNPLVYALMGHCGRGWALLGAKSAASVLLLLFRCPS